MALLKIACLIASSGGRAPACLPGDPACAEGTLPAPLIPASRRDWAGEDMTRVLWLTSRLMRAASFAGRGNGGQASLVASAVPQ
jgi:hypothetical protein